MYETLSRSTRNVMRYQSGRESLQPNLLVEDGVYGPYLDQSFHGQELMEVDIWRMDWWKTLAAI